MRLRNHRLTVRLTPAELAHITQQARIAGLSKEELIRRAVADVNLTAKPPQELAAMIRELNAIGNNLNQIARIANSKQDISRKEWMAVELLVKEIWEKVLKL